jgi:hypothetical protein
MVSAPVADATAGVVAAEAFVGTEPGPGNGTPLTLDGATATGQLTAPETTGTHPVGVRARDAAGNWSVVATTSITVESVPPPVEAPELMVSTRSDRAQAIPLQGEILDRKVYVFLDPGTLEQIKRVGFKLTGPRRTRISKVDDRAPYDLMGTNRRGDANAWNTRSMPHGKYTLTATIQLDDGTRQTVTATFTIWHPATSRGHHRL